MTFTTRFVFEIPLFRIPSIFGYIKYNLWNETYCMEYRIKIPYFRPTASTSSLETAYLAMPTVISIVGFSRTLNRP